RWGTIKEFLKGGSWDRANGHLYELIVRGGTPFDEYVRRKYGLLKAFRRSGRNTDSHGDGFVRWHSDRNLDALEKHNGLAIVYTHLNARWLDESTRAIKVSIRDRLAAIAARNVWLATASVILDRCAALERVCLVAT